MKLSEILDILKLNPEITAEQHAAAQRILQETLVRAPLCVCGTDARSDT